MRGQPLYVELKWTQECFSTPPPSYPSSTSRSLRQYLQLVSTMKKKRRSMRTSSRSSWRFLELLETSARPEGSRRTTDAVHRPPGGATHLFHRPLLLRFPGNLPPPPSKQPDFSPNIHVAGQNFATVEMLPTSVNLSPSPERKKIDLASNHIFYVQLCTIPSP